MLYDNNLYSAFKTMRSIYSCRSMLAACSLFNSRRSCPTYGGRSLVRAGVTSINPSHVYAAWMKRALREALNHFER